jgi:hypothetical protein
MQVSVTANGCLVIAEGVPGTKAWAAWLPDLLPQLAGCPDPLIEHELRRACQDFFERSRAWVVVQDAIAVAANQATVPLTPLDATTDVVRLEGAWLDGVQLRVRSTADMDAAFFDDWQAHTGVASTVVQIMPGTAMLYPIPLAGATTGLRLRLSVKPGDSALGIPEDLYVKYRDALAAGARARLMLQPGKPWTNEGLGVGYSGMFEAAIDRAARLVSQAYGRGRISARPMFA